jgi:flagellar motor protein MotB
MRKSAVSVLIIISAFVFILSGTQGCQSKKTAALPTPMPTSTPQPRLEKILFTYDGNLLWMDPDGNNRQEIFPDNTSKWFPSVSPDGWYVAYWVQTGKSYNLWVGDFKKRKAVQITFDSDGLDSDVQNFNNRNSCAWTADSQNVVYARANEIWKMNIEGYDQVSLTDTHNCISPAVSKDNRLVYVEKESETTSNLYIKNLDGVLAEKLTNLSGKKAGSPSFSPDGQKVIFTIEELDTINIYIIDINARKEDPLTYDGKSNCPVYNHDGNKVIFSSFITDKYQPEIWSMDADKSNRTKITKDGGTAPTWLCRMLSSPLPTPTPAAAAAAPVKQNEIFKIKEGQKLEPAQPAATVVPAMAGQAEQPVEPAQAAQPEPPVKESVQPQQPAEDSSDLSVKTIRQGDKLLLYPVIHYDTALSNIKPEFYKVLDDMVKIIKEHNSPIVIEGHTDNVPIKSKRFKSNYELSVARAQAVKKYLVEKHAIAASRISIVGLADKKPVVPNDTAENKYKNRRAEVTVIKITSGGTAETAAPVKQPASVQAKPSMAVPAATTVPTVMPTAAPVKVQVKSSTEKSTGW